MPLDMPDRGAGRFTPDTVARKSFGTSFRGYDQLEVRGYLSELAQVLNDFADREADYRLQIQQAEERVARAEQVDDSRLTEILGEETARVILAAKEASAEIRLKAEESVARLVRDAQADVDRLRAEAEAEAARRLEAAERTAESVREAAQVVRAEAVEAASAEIEAARNEGRQMVGEAQAVRERVLQDLARRKRAARQQLEQLRAGRDRLLAAYDLVRETLDRTTEELRIAMPEARAAADAAGRRAEEELDATAEASDVDVPAEVEPAAGAEPAGGSEPGPPPDVEPDTAADADVAVELTVVEVTELAAADDAPRAAAVDDAPPRPSRARRRRRPRADEEESSGEPFESVRLVAVEAVPDAGEEDAAAIEEEIVVDLTDADDDEVGELFARLRAVREEPEADAEPKTDADAPEATADPAVPPTAIAVDTDTETDLARRDAVTDEVERQLARRLKRVLADEQNEVLDLLRRASASSLDDVLPGVDLQSARYARSALADLRAAAAAGARFFGHGTVHANGTGATDVTDLADELAGMIVGLVRDRVERGLIEAGDDPEELAERIRACYREWKTQRIGDTARHFVLTAFSRGLFEAQPADVKLCWVIDDGGTPCPDAEDNALAGALDRREPFPTGHHYPPAHPGCRCLVVPERN